MSIKTKIAVGVLWLGAVCAACTTTSQIAPVAKVDDGSVSHALFETEKGFQKSREAGDAIGMAEIVRDRLKILKRVGEPDYKRRSSPSPAQWRRMEHAIMSTSRVMIADARRAADGDPELLVRIDRMFPKDGYLPTEDRQTFGGLFGTPRKVELTIGLEMDAVLVPGEPDIIRLPIDPSTGTTIYVQPARADVGAPVDLGLSVSPVDDAERVDAAVCDVRAAHGRLPCYIAPGEHSMIEMTLENLGRSRVSVLVYVSGNSTSVTAALDRE